jgi:hypothetical protein
MASVSWAWRHTGPRCLLLGTLRLKEGSGSHKPCHRSPTAFAPRLPLAVAKQDHQFGDAIFFERKCCLQVMSKGPLVWVLCAYRVPYFKIYPCSLPRLHVSSLHDSRGPRRGRPGSRARSSGALGASMQREGAVSDSYVQNKMTRIASSD